MIGRDVGSETAAANTDWQAFVATLDGDALRRFDEVVHRLPSTASPETVISQVDALISDASASHDHGDRPGQQRSDDRPFPAGAVTCTVKPSPVMLAPSGFAPAHVISVVFAPREITTG